MEEQKKPWISDHMVGGILAVRKLNDESGYEDTNNCIFTFKTNGWDSIIEFMGIILWDSENSNLEDFCQEEDIPEEATDEQIIYAFLQKEFKKLKESL